MKKWIVGIFLLASALQLSACGQRGQSVGTEQAAAASEMETQETGRPGQTEETITQETQPQGTEEPGEDGAVIIGGADGPTSIFMASKYDLTDLEEAVKFYILKQNDALESYPVQTAAHHILKQVDNEDGIVCYLYYGMFGFHVTAEGRLDEKEENIGGHFGLARVSLAKNEDGEYQLMDFWSPRDGGLLDDDVRENFPEDIQDEAIMAHSYYYQELSAECRRQAKALASSLAKALQPSRRHPMDEDSSDPVLQPTTIASEEGTEIIQPTTQATDELPAIIPVE